MDVAFEWDADLGIIRGSCHGPADAVLYQQRIIAFVTSGICPPSSCMLLDLRGLDFSTLTPETAAALADLREDSKELRKGAYTALLVDDNIDLLLATFLRERVAQSGPPLEVFIREDQALDWLLAKRDALKIAQ